MCGIAGILSLDASRIAPQEVLERMLGSIVHRGPDEDGRLCDGPLAMGMRRLSIIDLDDGKQPISNESGRYSVVFNGEIYNYRELRQELSSRGHTLRTASDTEVIVHLYEEYGESLVDHLRGMFAFAIWDNEQRSLFVARDRLGIKPLYYTLCDDTLVFASEIKALLEHPAVSASIDHCGLAAYLSLKYVPAPLTMFQGIRSLLPAHCMRIAGGQVSVRRYWDVSYRKSEPSCSEQEYVDQLDGHLRDAVRLRLRSDVPFGAFLSGGIDSSLIVALMTEILGRPVETFSVGFSDGDEPDELPHAQAVADRFGCRHHTLKVTASDFIRHAQDVSWHLDQPIADQATVATFMVAKLARQHVKMVLTGEGGDELFAGYARYVGEQYAPWFRPLPSPAGRLLRKAADRLPGLRRAKIALAALTQPSEAARYSNWFPLLNDDLKAEVMSDHLQQWDEPTSHHFAEHLSRTDAVASVDRMLYADCNLWLPDYLLLRGDKLTMANSLEARVPLLDHKLVEFAASLPASLKLRRGVRKYLLKQVASRYLPESIIHRRKQGFPIPIEKWLRHEARDMVGDLLSPDSLAARGLFNPRVVERLVRRHQQGTHDHATELWGLMSVEIWLRQYVDGNRPTAGLASLTENASGGLR